MLGLRNEGARNISIQRKKGKNRESPKPDFFFCNERLNFTAFFSFHAARSFAINLCKGQGNRTQVREYLEENIGKIFTTCR